jgi:hypothetical protein
MRKGNTNGTNYDDLIFLIMQSNIDDGCFNETNMANKLVHFGVNGTIFKSVKFVITTPLIYEHAPFVNGVHYMAQCINQVVQALNLI